MLAYNEAGLPEGNILQLLIGEEKRRGVAYLSVETNDGLFPIGTAFFVEVPWGTNRWIAYAVTARHCIEGHGVLYLEFTDKDGSYRKFALQPDQWVKSETTDLACFRITFDAMLLQPVNIEQHFFPLNGLDRFVYCGHDVYIIGLFSQHPYREPDPMGMFSKIEPIIRFGKVSLPDTEVGIFLDPRDAGDESKTTMVRARLIESISFRGESGSPVFLYEEHTIDQGAPRGVYKNVFGGIRKTPLTDADIHTPLLGMISSHWMAPNDVRNDRKKRLGDVDLNTGIAIVIPSEDIKDFLMNDKSIEKDRKQIPKGRNQPPSPLSNPPPNAFTKEDFENALKRASQRIQPLPPDEEKSKT